MKTNLLSRIACAMLLFSAFNCSVEPVEQIQSISNSINAVVSINDETNPPCTGLDPKVRITNNGTLIIDLEIYNDEGAFINSEIGIAPGSVSDWMTFTEGTTLFVVRSTNVYGEKAQYIMSNCTALNMELGADNHLVAVEPETL
ncbi:MAG: hypothetical protein R2812_05205 [Gelidibacter sp.]